MHREVLIKLVPFPPSVPQARAVARSFTELDVGTRANLELVVSELVTNSILHAALTDSQQITLHVTVLDDVVEVLVLDPGVQVRPADPGREGGRGLAIVDALTDGALEVMHDEHGHLSRARLPLPAEQRGTHRAAFGY